VKAGRQEARREGAQDLIFVRRSVCVLKSVDTVKWQPNGDSAATDRD
jgi:hypothetical protein